MLKPNHLTIAVNTSNQPIAKECTAKERNERKRVSAGQLVRTSIHDPLHLLNRPIISQLTPGCPLRSTCRHVSSAFTCHSASRW